MHQQISPSQFSSNLQRGDGNKNKNRPTNSLKTDCYLSTKELCISSSINDNILDISSQDYFTKKEPNKYFSNKDNFEISCQYSLNNEIIHADLSKKEPDKYFFDIAHLHYHRKKEKYNKRKIYYLDCIPKKEPDNISSTDNIHKNSVFKDLEFITFCNVITKVSEKDDLFKLIDSLKDPRLKQEYFIKLKDLTFKEQKIFPEKPFGVSDIINNRSSSNISSLVTTKDL